MLNDIMCSENGTEPQKKITMGTLKKTNVENTRIRILVIRLRMIGDIILY
jgi:hypothetical protein